ncbi:MAG: UvrB/UvrC motif-containing protein [Gemmataceae bacterium]|nr:UvrB/UvrC motif-containing protein [Gemmataceae bacterium]MDW8265511.1 UvrB/UvrC motif-containing protein [Gemmataceae bacterium]
MKKCQKCSVKYVTFHILEVLGDNQYEEFHLCEECAQKYIYESQVKSSAKGTAGSAAEESDDVSGLNQKECPECGLKFVEFRNSGRLGCPHDYEAFREELIPLLENIHGDVKHCGKVPHRFPQTKQTQRELLKLRKQLHQAVTKEAYEEAAQLRDRIRLLEQS